VTVPVSDALVIGEEWISEHYFTTDATKESFLARVLERRRGWDAEPEGIDTPRSRFTAARGELERRLVAVEEDPSAVSDDEIGDFHGLLRQVLGYRAPEFELRTEGPVTFVSQPAVDGPEPLAIVHARPVETIEDLIAKHADTLLGAWERDDEDAVRSVATTLSTLMTEPEGPTFALVVSGRWCLVAERERWPEGRWLAVDLQLVCERNDTKKGGEIDHALACLEAGSLAPDATGATWWTDTLADSVKHTVGVSKDLQEGVRLSIEIIANDVLSRRRVQGLDDLSADQAQVLAVQSLRYLYRILFLLYAEASPELGVLPVGVAEYDGGYGLDRLRDLALREVHTPQARSGRHLYESLDRLFVLVDSGHTPSGNEELDEGLQFGGLRADLFRSEATALIDEVGLGNAALLEVLRKLLLSKEDSRRQRGFVSYVELGINQLGAVYEGLMSYTGSFATEDLYEVAPNGDPSNGSWVVPVTRSDHLDSKDFVLATDPVTGERTKVLHRRGTFVFRLSGRDRQRSASYYTPEVLTRFTVGQALEELLDQDGHTTTAEEILDLTVCEPALGSGAFALEAVRQLAEEYLARRERELDTRVDPEARPRELAKARAHLALHNVYGVDLNATAVELAEVSLWLDTMVEGLQAPWFGLRLRRGNSLVGARRALYARHKVSDRSWLTTPPEEEPLTSLAALVDGNRAQTASMTKRIHHFLLPAQGWGSAVEVPKTVLDLVPAYRVKALKVWRTSIRRKPTTKQLARLEGLARRVEILWATSLRRLRIAEAESSRHIDLWGRDVPSHGGGVSREQIESSLADPNGAYQRLRLAMDAWCALWYWPLTEDTVSPPDLEEWLSTMEAVLGTHVEDPKRSWMTTFGEAVDWEELGRAEEIDLELSFAKDIGDLLEARPWLDVCRAVAAEQGFFHWELDFATVFARGGFDLQVGNPPWVRPTVDLSALLGDSDPWWSLATKASEADKADRLPGTLELPGTVAAVVAGATDAAVTAAHLSDETCFPVLSGQPDLYRAFMAQVWAHQSPKGTSGLIHMESHFTDAKAHRLRRATYRHLRRHWQFINELVLFDIHDLVRYGINVYGRDQEPGFLHATSLYHPDTVSRSLVHDGSGPEPGFKDDDGRWDTRPHKARIQHVNLEALALWRDILDGESASDTQMVYTVNSAAANTMSVLAQAARVRSLELQFSAGWHEKGDRIKGRFIAQWGEADWKDAILQGPHVHVLNPMYKWPNPTMKHNQDWSAVDLEVLPADALPVTAYKPSGDRHVYDSAYTHWGSARAPARDLYRIAWRAMAANTGERTLIPAAIPPGAAHVNGVFCIGSPDVKATELMAVQATMGSLLADFAIRAAPKSGIYQASVDRLPLVSLDHPLLPGLVQRSLRLNCLTDAYAALWRDAWHPQFVRDRPVLARFDEWPIEPDWSATSPLRRAADRRNAQVEIDALVAMMLGVPIDDLCTIYRTQFAVLYGYDHGAYTFDANGRLVPTEVLQAWRRKGDAITEVERTAVHPGSGIAYTYELPFGTLDREADMRTAYAEFERRLAEKTKGSA